MKRKLSIFFWAIVSLLGAVAAVPPPIQYTPMTTNAPSGMTNAIRNIASTLSRDLNGNNKQITNLYFIGSQVVGASNMAVSQVLYVSGPSYLAGTNYGTTIVGSHFVGNGAGLTNVMGVGTNFGDISVGTIVGTNFVGNGVGLTNLGFVVTNVAMVVTQITFLSGTNYIILMGTNSPDSALLTTNVDWYVNRVFGAGNPGGDYFGDGSALSNLTFSYTPPDILNWTLDAGNVSWLPGFSSTPPSYSNYWFFRANMQNGLLPMGPYKQNRGLLVVADTNNWENSWAFAEWQIPCNDMRTNISVTFYLLSAGETCIPWRNAIGANDLHTATNATVDQFTDHELEFPAGTNILTVSDSWVIRTNSLITIYGVLGATTNLFTNMPAFWVLAGKVIQW